MTMTSGGMEATGTRSSPHSTLRTVSTAAAFTTTTTAAVSRRWSRKVVQSTPPPLPLISLPPDDDWEEFNVPVKTGFGYTLPHMNLENEERHDTSAPTISTMAPPATGTTRPRLPSTHDRAAICRVLSEYMTQNETFQVRRHGFGIDTTLVYKRIKSSKSKSSLNMNDLTRDTITTDDVSFDAFFESGNLDRVYRVLGRHYATTTELLGGGTSTTSTSSPSSGSSPWSSPFPFFVKADHEYDLYCDTDMSTHGHIQWYFFRVTVPLACFERSSSSSSLRIRINIRNMLKKTSLYNDGMLPAVYVEGDHGRGWHHAGTNVCYFKNTDTYRNRKSGKSANYYTLSFVYEIEQPSSSDSVIVYFAHCYPYTYSRLQQYLLSLQKDPSRHRFFRRRVLCKTIAGNICDVLTITDFGQEDDTRSGVILTARVHPGESNASFIMHGIIDFLTGPSIEARFLRNRFVFKIVPMLNPDGVIHGNYRCSLAGTDLNRRYVDPSTELHPTVLATKNMILSMRKTRPVSLYCDIHGHSRKKNMFLYGCVPYEDDNPRAEAAKLRLFAHVLSKTCGAGQGGYFSFSDCTFSVSKSKKGTGRVVVWDEVHVLNSFTLEASFFGVGTNKKRSGSVIANQQSRPTINPLETSLTHFMPHDLRCAGVNLALALIPFSHLLDRDRPMPPPSAIPIVGGEGPIPMVGSAAFVSRPVSVIGLANSADAPRRSQGDPLETKGVRLAPLLNTSSGGSASTPFLHPRSPLGRTVHATPAGDSSSSSPRPLLTGSPLGLFVGVDALLTSLPSTEDLLREIEETLPENYAQYGDSDDEGESAGSESDPSGDNMEAEELERQDSWKDLVKDTEVKVQEPPPKLTKNRSELLLKRFSDSMLGQTLTADDVEPYPQSVDLVPVEITDPVKPTPAPIPEEPAQLKPIVSLAPVRAPMSSSSLPARRNLSVVHYHGHPRDRNKDIAALHLRAVQRRSRAKRTTHRIVMNEHDFV